MVTVITPDITIKNVKNITWESITTGNRATIVYEIETIEGKRLTNDQYIVSRIDIDADISERVIMDWDRTAVYLAPNSKCELVFDGLGTKKKDILLIKCSKNK